VLYWWSKFVLVGPLLRLLCRPTIEGVEHVPEHGGAILASNHLAVVDSFVLPLLVSRRITFLAKAEYFTQPGFVGRLKKIFFTGVGQVPIDRSSGSAAHATLATAVRILREGSCWASTRKAPARPTGGCTRARPAWLAWRSRPECR
jgi:1-acyl-sn-glycerol-3-phosphate acyltransferase